MSDKLKRKELVTQYLTQVCMHVKAKDVHNEIQMEIKCHLDELIDEKLSCGLSEAEAVSEALGQMGNPDEVGRQLNAAHKPKVEWSLIALVMAMVGVGLVAMYAMQFALSERYSNLLYVKAVYVGIGAVALIVIYFLDYRKIKAYSWYLYCSTVLLMLLNNMYGYRVNGASGWLGYGPFWLNFMALSPYLLILAYAGFLTTERKKEQKQPNWFVDTLKVFFVYILVPGMLYLRAHSFTTLAIYCFAVIFMFLFVARRLKLVVGVITSMISMGVIYFYYTPEYQYLLAGRFTGYLKPDSDPQGSGYMILRSLEAIRSGGMWGQGFGVKAEKLPYIQTDMIFTYLVYSLGWVFGLGLVALFLLLVSRLIDMTGKLKDHYAKAVVIGLSSVIGIQCVWSILMSIGILPMTSIALPFISFGGSHTVIELAVVGLILNVYKRKQMNGGNSDGVKV